MASERTEEDLRGLYLDWCSTQVARRFLELSGDEIWLRSHSTSPPPSPPAPASASLSAVSRIPDYLDIVRKTALALAEELGAGYVSSGYRDAMGFLIIIAVLIFKPTGLFARSERVG